MESAVVRRVESAGLALAVREHTPWQAGKQSVILVHGYPDQQDVWNPLVRFLPADQLHIVTYDVRGAGESDVPEHRSGYRTALLVEDLLAVVAATVPDHGRFHLVGHDWGSVQLWDAVHATSTDDRLRNRVASFTSISGPSLDHLAYLARHPGGRNRRLLEQAARSWYVAAFQLPLVPDLAWRLAGRWKPGLGRNGANGLGLYRANIGRRLRRPGTRTTDVPVQVIRPLRDRFIAAVAYEDLHVTCSDVSVVDIDAGHWVIRTYAEQVAVLVTDHVRAHSAAPPA